jgi:DNA-3-methyladenine glycosylase I
VGDDAGRSRARHGITAPDTASESISSIARVPHDLTRCEWAPLDQPRYLAYHDEEWGVPSHDDRHLFEMLVLEGAQAGLSWSTILNKREGYRKAFAGFDAAAVARFTEADVERLMLDAGIVRNRLKIESAVNNARRVTEVQNRGGSLDAYLWSFVDGRPIVGNWNRLSELPAETAESKAMSKDLKRRGFRFVGPTVCYAFMQAVGMVQDHVASCFRFAELQGGSSAADQQ